MLLYILLVSVAQYDALDQVYKLVDSFPVVENAQYLFAKRPHLLTHPREKPKPSKRQSCI